MVDKIVLLADRKGWNQGEFEALAKLPQARISKWKKGEGEPTARQALRMAHLLGVSVDYLVDDLQEEPSHSFTATTEAERTALDMVRELGLTKGDVIRLLSGRGPLGRPGSRPVEMGPGTEV